MLKWLGGEKRQLCLSSTGVDICVWQVGFWVWRLGFSELFLTGGVMLNFQDRFLQRQAWRVTLAVEGRHLQWLAPWKSRLLCPWNSSGKNTGGVAIPFSRGSSQPRDQTRVSCFVDGFFTFWVTREALSYVPSNCTSILSMLCLKTLLQNSHWNWKLQNYHYKGTKSLLECRRQGPRTITYINYLHASEKTYYLAYYFQI